ncbi:MAG: LysM peptidoglycan-binding domain-containing protein [Chloroflexi bacterium]|nr:LysM peptidoglycan-binding domain-containing protein [Chloroflexota bacterium]
MSEVMQDGWTAVTPAEFTVTVTRPFECEHVRFKNRTNFACLDVYKKDSYDNAGLPSWLITLKPAYGGVALTGLTDGTGWVRFNELASGDYIVSETPQVGWVPVSPASSAITLIANGTCSVFTFYNRQPDNLPVFSDPPTASGACVSRYTVQSGDTLFRIALRFGVTVRELQGANRIADPSLIHPGTALCIP